MLMSTHGGQIEVMQREKNVGWRIDYQIVSGNLANKIEKQKKYIEILSLDHAPLIFTYKI